MKTIPAFMLFCLSFLFYLAPAQEKDAPATAKIVKSVDDNTLEVKATCISNADKALSLRYEMEVQKKGRSGSSKNKQSGEFEIGMNETKILANNRFNKNSKDNFQIKLRIYQNNKLISTDSLKFITN